MILITATLNKRIAARVWVVLSLSQPQKSWDARHHDLLFSLQLFNRGAWKAHPSKARYRKKREEVRINDHGAGISLIWPLASDFQFLWKDFSFREIIQPKYLSGFTGILQAGVVKNRRIKNERVVRGHVIFIEKTRGSTKFVPWWFCRFLS